MTTLTTESTIAVNPFARGRHVRGTGFSFLDHPDWERELIARIRDGIANEDVKEGFMPGVKLVNVSTANEAGVIDVMTGLIRLDDGDKLEAMFQARQDGEDRFIDVRAIGAPKKAAWLDVVLYHSSTLAVDGDNSIEDGWEVISLNALPDDEECPQNPVSMARNLLNLEGGSGGAKVEYTAEDFAKAVWYWSTHAMCGSTPKPISLMADGFEFMLPRVVNELQTLESCVEDTVHHRGEATWEHTLEVVRGVTFLARVYKLTPRQAHILHVAAILHDVGKPATRKVDGDKVSFHKHWTAGAGSAVGILANFDWGLEEDEEAAVVRMIANHDRFLALCRNGEEKNFEAIARIANACENFTEFTTLNVLAQADSPHEMASIRGMLTFYKMESDRRNKEKAVKKQVSQILRDMGVAPGPVFGKVTAKILEDMPLASEDLEARVREVHSSL